VFYIKEKEKKTLCFTVVFYIKEKEKKQWLLEEMFESRFPQTGGRE
jgi:hypothetical protein